MHAHIRRISLWWGLTIVGGCASHAHGPTLTVALTKPAAQVAGARRFVVPVEYYPAEGKSWSEVKRAWTDREAIGQTNWSYGFKPRKSSLHSECIIEDIDFEVQLKVVAPELRNVNGNRSLRREWRTFIRTVMHHEKRHVKVVMEVLGWARQEIRGLDCFSARPKLKALDAAVDQWNVLFDKCDVIYTCNYRAFFADLSSRVLSPPATERLRLP